MRHVMRLLCAGFLALLMSGGLLPPALGEEVRLPDGRALRLEAAQVGEQVRGGDCRYERIFRLDVWADGQQQPLQSLYYTSEEEQIFLRAVDLDFDGWPDLDAVYLLGASNSQHTFFFWDAQQGRFVPRNFGCVWLSNYELRADQGLIVNYIHDSAATGVKEIYRWAGNRLQLVRRGEIAWAGDAGDTLVLTLTEPEGADGGLRETYRATLDLATAGEGEELALYQTRESLLWQGL